MSKRRREEGEEEEEASPCPNTGEASDAINTAATLREVRRLPSLAVPGVLAVQQASDVPLFSATVL